MIKDRHENNGKIQIHESKSPRMKFEPINCERLIDLMHRVLKNLNTNHSMNNALACTPRIAIRHV